MNGQPRKEEKPIAQPVKLTRVLWPALEYCGILAAARPEA